jgi:ribonuclease P protein component
MGCAIQQTPFFTQLMDFTLRKNEKLRSRTAINRLFDEGKSLMAFPLRAAYRLREPGENNVQFLVTIPKKRIRKAVNRVTLRRRVRESYRLARRELLTPVLEQHGAGVDIAFVYLDSTPAPYSVIQEKMASLLTRIAQAVADGDLASNPQDQQQ